MKRLNLIPAVAALAFGGLAFAHAQGAPDAAPAPAPAAAGPAAGGPDGNPPPPPPGMCPPGPGRHDMGMGRPPWFGGHGPDMAMMPPAFGLFATQGDKHLSTGDVTVIAQSILLENGNHVWKVQDVAAQPDKSIQFSYATQHGDVVATFAVDPATGFIKRVS